VKYIKYSDKKETQIIHVVTVTSVDDGQKTADSPLKVADAKNVWIVLYGGRGQETYRFLLAHTKELKGINVEQQRPFSCKQRANKKEAQQLISSIEVYH
jgi:hypothetical protein